LRYQQPSSMTATRCSFNSLGGSLPFHAYWGITTRRQTRWQYLDALRRTPAAPGRFDRHGLTQVTIAIVVGNELGFYYAGACQSLNSGDSRHQIGLATMGWIALWRWKPDRRKAGSQPKPSTRRFNHATCLMRLSIVVAMYSSYFSPSASSKISPRTCSQTSSSGIKGRSVKLATIFSI
jgi:hypothetical protein